MTRDLPQREPYQLAAGMKQGDKVLLHVCCAPCSCEIIQGIILTGLDLTVYFYNPNIHPVQEYEIRKAEVTRFCEERGISFVDADYDTDRWFERVKGYEDAPEKGKRCSLCFELRLERTALYAHEHRFPYIGTSLSISRHKNQAQVHQAGFKSCEPYNDVTFWDYNWRQKGGSDRGAALAKEKGFYRQNYCGCTFSLRNRMKDEV